MKRFITGLIFVAVVFAAVPVLAALRMLGYIDKTGLTDNDPHHVAIVMKDRQTLISDDAGTTWRFAKAEELPLTLQPLTEQGDLRYRLAGNILICSTNSGETWQNISPWPFLRQALDDSVRREKEVYKLRYGRWLPNPDNWLISFSFSSLFMLIAVGFIIARRRRPWFVTLVLSLATYAVIGIALLEIREIMVNACWGTLESQYGHYDPVMYPLWPLAVFLQLAGNPRLTPLVCMLCFPLTPLFGSLRPDARGLSWRLWLLWAMAACLFIIFAPLAVYYGRGWILDVEQTLK